MELRVEITVIIVVECNILYAVRVCISAVESYTCAARELEYEGFRIALADEITLLFENDRVYRKCTCEKVNGLKSFSTKYSNTFPLVNSSQKTSPDHRESLV